MRAFKWIVLCIPWTFAFIGMLWVFIHRFPPSGTIVFDIPFDGTSAWMDPFLPAERVTSPGLQEGGWRGQRMLQDPVYSAARVPGIFDQLELQIEFRPNRQPYAEFGMLRDESALAFEFIPIWFAPLQSDQWRAASTDGLKGYVRGSLPDQALASSDYSGLEVWHASSTPLYAKDPSAPLRETTVSLRGSHDFWVLPSGKNVEFEFDLQDANRSNSGRTAILQILNGDRVVRNSAIGLGGSRDTSMGKVVSARIAAENLAPGVYQVRVISDDDIFIRAIRTSSVHWVVGPRLVFGDTVGYSTTTQPGKAWGNSRHLVLETFHREGLQTVRFGSNVAVLMQTHVAVHLNRTDTTTAAQELNAPKGDVRIVGDGYFSFMPEAFFVPQPRRVTVFTDPDAEGIQAVLTPYKRPERLEDGWYRTTIQFALDASRDHSRFALSIPGALANNASFDIRRVVLTYKRPPLDMTQWFRVVKQELVNAWHRLRSQ